MIGTDLNQMNVLLTLDTGANGVFASTILDLAKRKPHLIFSDPKPYDISSV
jgi:hypothetical protein